jgi:DNA-directed RNA polymerase specialized sigma24 family protein
MMSETKNRGLELNEVAINYRNTGDERYFEKLWEEVKPFAYMKGKKYYNTISKKDMTELAMVCLYDCCRCIKEGTNVLTYYGRVLVNRYHDFYKKPKTRGNDILNNEALSLDYEYNEEGNTSAFYNMVSKTEDDYFDKEDFYKECQLVGVEITICELLDYGYKQTEILNKLNIQRKEYKSLIKTIQDKIEKYHDFGTIY